MKAAVRLVAILVTFAGIGALVGFVAYAITAIDAHDGVIGS